LLLELLDIFDIVDDVCDVLGSHLSRGLGLALAVHGLVVLDRHLIRYVQCIKVHLVGFTRVLFEGHRRQIGVLLSLLEALPHQLCLNLVRCRLILLHQPLILPVQILYICVWIHHRNQVAVELPWRAQWPLRVLPSTDHLSIHLREIFTLHTVVIRVKQLHLLVLLWLTILEFH